MTVNRRQLLILGGSAVVTAGIAAWLFASSRLTDGFTAVPSAKAATPDLTTLLEPPALGDKILGKSDAPVTIVEYASATCPHCAAFHKDVFPQLKSEFIDTGKVKFIFREFPFDDLALAAFMLARCAPPEKYFPMLDVLFEQQQVWASKEARVELGKIAQLAGIGEDGFAQRLIEFEDLAGSWRSARRRRRPWCRADADLLRQRQPIWWRGPRSISSGRSSARRRAEGCHGRLSRRG